MNDTHQEWGNEYLVHTLAQERFSGSREANEAMTSLIQRWTPIFRAIMLRRGVRATDMDDLLQDIFLRALRKIHQLKEPRALNAWMISIAVGLTINHHVRKKVFASLEELVEEHNTSSLLHDDHSDDVVDNLIADEEIEFMQQTILTLPEMDQQLLQDFYLRELSLKELHSASGQEDVTRTPIGTIKRRLHTARGRLRDAIIQRSSKTTE